MTKASLQGLRVLVTRPQAQAQSLVDMITLRGGTAVSVPAIDVVGVTASAALREAVQRCGEYDAVIFVSANAVKFADEVSRLRELSLRAVFAPGKATAAALRNVGVDGVQIPEHGFDSEALLALPSLKSVENQRIAIVRGSGGRDLLRDKLSGRGALVEYVDVYRRQRPEGCCENLRTALSGKLDTALVSSGEALENLLSCLSQRERQELLLRPLFVPSQRVAGLARSHGFEHVLISESPDDTGVVNSLLRWATGRETIEPNERQR